MQYPGFRRSLASFVANASSLYAAHRAYWRARLYFEQRRHYPSTKFLLSEDGSEPSFEHPTSQLCTANQCLEPAYAQRCSEFRSPPRFNRKQWEFAYILQALHTQGRIKPGARGLAFGCGNEPLPAVLAARGCTIVATDQPVEKARDQGWIADQHADGLDRLNARKLCPPDLFRDLVSFRFVDMNAIPGDLRAFDFLWSACALEHLGSLRHGLDFIRNAMGCLHPGGIAIHTTEFNLSSNVDTLEHENCVIYRRRDIDQLTTELSADGHELAPVTYNAGRQRPDKYVDVPPYRSSPHLKLRLEDYVTTSIGLIVHHRN